jgi:hypothetical protein
MKVACTGLLLEILDGSSQDEKVAVIGMELFSPDRYVSLNIIVPLH